MLEPRKPGRRASPSWVTRSQTRCCPSHPRRFGLQAGVLVRGGVRGELARHRAADLHAAGLVAGRARPADRRVDAARVLGAIRGRAASRRSRGRSISSSGPGVTNGCSSAWSAAARKRCSSACRPSGATSTSAALAGGSGRWEQAPFRIARRAPRGRLRAARSTARCSRSARARRTARNCSPASAPSSRSCRWPSWSSGSRAGFSSRGGCSSRFIG